MPVQSSERKKNPAPIQQTNAIVTSVLMYVRKMRLHPIMYQEQQFISLLMEKQFMMKGGSPQVILMATAVITGQIRVPAVLNRTEILRNVLPL